MKKWLTIYRGKILLFPRIPRIPSTWDPASTKPGIRGTLLFAHGYFWLWVMGYGLIHGLWIASMYDISMMSCNGLWVKIHGLWALGCTHLHSMYLPNGLWYLSFYPFILPNILHTSYVYILPKYVNTSCCTYVLLNHKITYTCFSVLCESVSVLENY